MPFGEDFLSDEGMSPPLIQSDLLNSVEPESPVNQGVGNAVGPTVVALDDQADLNEQLGVPEADMDIHDEAEENLFVSAPASTLKKRGRPSLSASATPAKSVASRTPRSTKSAAAPKSAGRSTGKRKAAESELEEDEPEEDDEPEATPAPKRGRPARSAGTSASARIAAKAAKKPTRGRPKSTTPAKKAGRPKKVVNGEEAVDEFEVEDIVDSIIDADTMEHMYLVKWKNYPASANTWEPKMNLKGSLDLVRKADAKKKKAEAAEAAEKASAKKTAAAASREERKTARGKQPKPVKAVKKAPGRPLGRKRRARA
ncbi:hypothetical protein C8A00DRAFT_33965 [Chaetomidium leptoderma]|uniref:Chromo domain-containing protein n=1 Tax=Chaetomidium leptoderma TaxID=669021 RepID=A0AAN6VN43_9PEZI|nr:hypothetical protein C8A00DRAFT_33965 [Chaetomidium leptoderma]